MHAHICIIRQNNVSKTYRPNSCDNPRSSKNTTYIIRYKLFTEIVHLTIHTDCKNQNFLSTYENDIILELN